jgi:ribonuclease HI
MGPAATVFQAEVKASTMVCQTLKQRKDMDILIRCDSQAAIAAIMSINIVSKTVLECRELLNKLGSKNRVTLSWIKAHANHLVNELADHLAKSGTTQRGNGPWSHEPASHFKNNLLTKINVQWQKK